MSGQQNRIVGIVGRKGSGKSTRTAVLVKHAPRIVVFDPMEDHRAALPDHFEGLEDIEAVWEYFNQASREETFACSYTPGDDPEREFEELCKVVYEYGNVLLVVEEVPIVVKANYLPKTFGRIVRTGRHRDIDILWTAQRASEVARTLTASTDIWIFFSQTEPRDLDAIAERCGRDIADKVAALGLHDFFVWDAIAREVIKDSSRLLKKLTPADRPEPPEPPKPKLWE